jgi:hypothetical protein
MTLLTKKNLSSSQMSCFTKVNACEVMHMLCLGVSGIYGADTFQPAFPPLLN